MTRRRLSLVDVDTRPYIASGFEIEDTTGDIYVNGSLINSSSGTSPIQTKTITLSAAQIKNLVASTITAVPAPGAGKVLIPSQVVAQYKRGTADFTNPGGHASFDLFYSAAAQASNSFKEAGADSFFGGGDGVNVSALIQDGESGFAWTSVSVQSGYLTPQSFFANAPISIGNTDPSATDYAVGDGTLTVTVLYSIVSLQ